MYLCTIVQSNDKVLGKIGFVDDGHKYFIDDVILRGVTTVLGSYSPEFDSMYTSRVSAYKSILTEDEFKRLRKESFGFNYKPDEAIMFPLFDEICGGSENVEVTQNSILQDWLDVGTRGTALHKDRENESIARGFEINPWTHASFPVITFPKALDNEVYDMDLSIIPDGYYTEFLVYDKNLPLEHTVCGTIDRLWVETVDGIRYTDTGDYKFNTKAPEESKYNRMHKPLSHLWANKVVNYGLQASWYQQMLKSHGFVPRNSEFTWYSDGDSTESRRYPVVVMVKEIEAIREDLLKDVYNF